MSARPFLRPLVLLLLAAAVFAAFAGVLRNGWILLDDPATCLENPHVSGGLTAAAAPLWFLHAPHGGNWHPLTSLSHMLDVQLFGLAPGRAPRGEPAAARAERACCWRSCCYRSTGAWWRSLLVAALFALHPLRVESVAWVSERKDVLSGLFFLLTLEAYRRWAARPARGRYALVALALALGLMSKPMLVTLPFVLVLLDVWPLGRLRGARPAPRRPARPRAASARRPARREVAAVRCSPRPRRRSRFLVQRATGAVGTTVALGRAARQRRALVLALRRHDALARRALALLPVLPGGAGCRRSPRRRRCSP